MQIRIEFRAETYLFLALLILTLPASWIFAAVLAAAIHELCHMVALRVAGVRIYRITIRINGIVMETEGIHGFREFTCALAGPLGSLGLLLFAKWIPKTSVCGLIQGLYNLLPLYPMDGGRALYALLSVAAGEIRAAAICRAVKPLMLLTLTAAVVCFSFLSGCPICGAICIVMLLAGADKENVVAKKTN